MDWNINILKDTRPFVVPLLYKYPTYIYNILYIYILIETKNKNKKRVFININYEIK